MTALCREFGNFRTTGYRWRRRFEQAGTLTAPPSAAESNADRGPAKIAYWLCGATCATVRITKTNICRTGPKAGLRQTLYIPEREKRLDFNFFVACRRASPSRARFWSAFDYCDSGTVVESCLHLMCWGVEVYVFRTNPHR